MEKFELSLWRDYFSKDVININNKSNPGKDFHLLTATEVTKLEIGKCYYVWDDAELGTGYYHWRYPCSYIGKNKRTDINVTGANGYTYHFINEQGNPVNILGYDSKRIAINTAVTKEEKIKILANENMQHFQGKIYNIIFTSKIDGTHTITFEVPQYYLDIYENVKKPNEYLEWLHLKTKIKLLYDNEWYTFVINNREEKKQKGYITYSFSASDLSIEELSKTGYTLNFTEDEETIELCGLGTIKELTERVLLGTEWSYDEELTTANQQEFLRTTKLNPITGLYEDVYEPVMAYASHYSPFLKKYVYQTEFYVQKALVSKIQQNYKNLNNNFIIKNSDINTTNTNIPIYYTTKTITDCSGSVKNIIVKNSQFTNNNDWQNVNDTSGWNVYQDGDDFCLQATKNSTIYTKNFTSKNLESKPYVFRINTLNSSNTQYNLIIKNGTQTIKTYNGLTVNYNYCIYPDKNINNLEIQIKFLNSVIVKEFLFYEIALRDGNNEALAITKANLGTNSTISHSMSAQIFNYTPDGDYTNRGKIKQNVYILLPNAVVNATSRAEPYYFIEPYKNLQEVQDATNDYTISILDENYIVPIDTTIINEKIGQKISEKSKAFEYVHKDLNIQNLTNSMKEVSLFSEKEIELNASSNLTKYVKYIDNYNQEFYYIVKKIVYQNKNYYLWKRVDLLYTNEKRRLITGSRSNRWNFIQDIAEKFKVYPKFLVLHNPKTGECIYNNGRPVKKIFYVDRFGDENYSGFKDGINVNGINRKILSEEIVTKLYVNNIEADHSDNGLITIQLAGQNPSKENYIYNFRHFLNIGVLDDNFSQELAQHEGFLKSINEVYLNAVEKRDKLADSVNNLLSVKNTLETQLEENNTNIENEKLKFTKQLDYYRTGSADIGITPEQIKNNYGKSVLSSVGKDKDVVKTKSIKYNSFFVYNDNFIPNKEKKKSYTFFGEIHGLTNTENNKNKLNRFKTAYRQKFGYYPIVSSKIKNRFIYGSQQEIFKLNKKIPFNDNYTYCQKNSDGSFSIVSNTTVKNKTDSERAKLYIYWKTAPNANWWYWSAEKNYIHFSFNNSEGKEYYNVLASQDYIQNGNKIFPTWLLDTQTRYNGNTKITNNNYKWEKKTLTAIIPEKEGILTAQLETIDDLIHNTDIGQKQIIEKLYTALINYYIELEKYEKAKNYVERLKREKQSLIENFENKYIQFIKEGYWGEDNYTNNDSYYLDAVSVGHDSAIPKVEYTIDVLDLSSIPYYKDYKVKVGDETFIIDTDMFGSNNGTPIREKVIITEIQKQLDDNSKNKMTVRNYTNRFEDLFHRITASVTNVETKSGEWSRAEILNKDGTIDSSLLTTLHGENAKWVNNSIGLLNTLQMDEQGIVLTSQINEDYKIKITSTGIFLTETATKNEEWLTAISAKGINADVIKTGQLLTSKISIFSEEQPAQIWDKLGISMYKIEGEQDSFIDTSSFVRLDQYGLYLIDNNTSFGFSTNGEPWFKGLGHEQSIEEIRKYSTVSITRKGFCYNAINRNGAKIYVGDYDNFNGIQVLNKSNNTIFEANASKAFCKIASFNFDENHMWSNIGRVKGKNEITQSSTLDNVFKNGGLYFGQGLSMHNIKLDPKTGTATFNDIVITGGNITGNINISGGLLVKGGSLVVQNNKKDIFTLSKKGNLTTSGAISAGGNVSISGNTTISGNLTVNGESFTIGGGNGISKTKKGKKITFGSNCKFTGVVDASSFKINGEDLFKVIKGTLGITSSNGYASISNGSATGGFNVTNNGVGVTLVTNINITATWSSEYENEDGKTVYFTNVPALAFTKKGYPASYIAPTFHSGNGIKWIELWAIAPVNGSYVCYTLFE